MAEGEELFKRTAFGGYDKDDVQQELQKLKDNAYEEKTRIEKRLGEATRELDEKDKAIREKDKKIKELQDMVDAKDREIFDMEKKIREKYQSYVDNYDTIGSMIYEAKIRAKQIDRQTDADRQQIISEAQAEAQRIKGEAQAEAQKTIADVQRQIDERNKEGRQQYDAVQEELGRVVEIFNQVQKQFMNSYRDIQKIVSDRPESAVSGLGRGALDEDD